MAYATATDVQALNPYRVINATTKPATADVTQWIVQVEAEYNGTFAAVGIPYPVTGNGAEIVKGWIANCVSGIVRRAYAAAGGDGGNDDGQTQIDACEARLEDIMSNASKYYSMLVGGASDDTSRVRSYVVNNDDGKSIAGGDFAPKFSRDDVF